MKTVLVTDHVFPNLDPENAVLEGIGTLREAGSVKDAELLELARDADAVLNCYRPLSAEIVEAMKNCQIIARYGIGVDTIPLEVATSRGIHVTNVPDYCIEEVADHGLALILAFTRGIIRGLDQTRGGAWNVKLLRPLHRQRDQTLGLVGFGRIARALAHHATALGYEIIVSDPFLSAEAVRKGGARAVDLDTLFTESDVVSLHAPLTSKTRHMVNAQRLATMRPGAVLVNTSRGGLVTRRSSPHSAAGLSVAPVSTSSKPNHPQQVPPRLVKCPTSLSRPIWRSTRSRRSSNSSARQRSRFARSFKAARPITRSTRSSSPAVHYAQIFANGLRVEACREAEIPSGSLRPLLAV
jgi:D-3-phosphoglycerate dehydrogenase